MNSIYGKVIYTGKKVIQNAYLIFNGNRIVDVSKNKRGKLVSSCKTITPAFIDPHSHIGLHRGGEPANEGETNDWMDSIVILAEVLDSIQMDDMLFNDSIEAGVLYSCVVPGSGNIIGGRSAVIRNYGKTTTEAFIKTAGLKVAFGYNTMGQVHWKGTRPYTRMGAIAILRKKLYGVKQKMKKNKKTKNSLSAEEKLLADVLNKKITLRVHVHKTDDIAALLRVVDEFNLKITVEHAMDVFDKHIFEVLRKRKIPVVYGPVDVFPYKVELKHKNWRNIKHLVSSGVEFGFMTDHPVALQHTLFLMLRWFLRTGLSKQDAIEIITRKNAKILGIDNILGTLEKKKWASFICWNGDPFDLTSYPVKVYGEGNLLYKD